MDHFTLYTNPEKDKSSRRPFRLLTICLAIQLILLLVIAAALSTLYQIHFSHTDYDYNGAYGEDLDQELSFAEAGILSFLLVGGSDLTERLILTSSGQLESCLSQDHADDFILYGTYGTFSSTSNSIVYCGGHTGDHRCYKLTQALNVQQQPRAHRLETAVDVPVYAATSTYNGFWWITGGRSKEGRCLKSSLLYDFAMGLWANGPDLPDERYGHCLVKIKPNHYFLVAGVRHLNSSKYYPEQTYLAVSSRSRFQPLWYNMPRIPEGREGAACGLIQVHGKAKTIVVAGGNRGTSLQSTDLFMVDLQTWVKGPDLIEPRHYASAVQFSLDSLFIVAGTGTDGTVNSILEMKSDLRSWRKVSYALIRKRAYFTAVKIPYGFVEC